MNIENNNKNSRQALIKLVENELYSLGELIVSMTKSQVGLIVQERRVLKKNKLLFEKSEIYWKKFSIIILDQEKGILGTLESLAEEIRLKRVSPEVVCEEVIFEKRTFQRDLFSNKKNKK